MGAENGVLIRKGAAIQVLKDVRTIVLDKTGTITEGKPGVTDIVLAAGQDERETELLALAASLETTGASTRSGARSSEAQRES